MCETIPEEEKMIRCIRIAYRQWREIEAWLADENRPAIENYITEFCDVVRRMLERYEMEGKVGHRCEFWVVGGCACEGKVKPEKQIPCRVDSEEQDYSQFNN
jgi:hypothetical protein